MRRMLFVNLAVADLRAARRFYTGLGFAVNEDFSDAGCACIVVSDTIFVMLLVRDRFADFVTGAVADPAVGTSVINCLSAASREEVDEFGRTGPQLRRTGLAGSDGRGPDVRRQLRRPRRPRLGGPLHGVRRELTGH